MANRLHEAIIGRARAPEFFERFGVPDTLDGRFDLVALHAWLTLARLREEPALHEISQRLTNALFAAFDEGLRELGISDQGMGRRMKKIADAFYGRCKAYDEAGDEAAMAQALSRNLYRGNTARTQDAEQLSRYVFEAKAALARSNVAQGEIDFGSLPQ
ncbi:MAG TPA: ubiquinol-cytochrome C chaperone family protein [Rhizomicrobium sp.]